MDISDFLSPADALIDVKAPGKTRLLQDLSRRAAAAVKLPEDLIASEILKREALGSTGTGGGIAIPHARIAGLDEPFGMLARLSRPMAFDAIDGQAVDLLFLLLLPANADKDQLAALASVARVLRDSKSVAALRRAPDSLSLFRTMIEPAGSPNSRQ